MPNTSAVSEARPKSRARAWTQFVLSIVGFWFFLWVFTPFWVSHSKIHQEFTAATEDLNVPVGAMYYNDLPFINDAAMVLRDTWRFLPRDMADKKARARQQDAGAQQR